MQERAEDAAQAVGASATQSVAPQGSAEAGGAAASGGSGGAGAEGVMRSAAPFGGGAPGTTARGAILRGLAYAATFTLLAGVFLREVLRGERSFFTFFDAGDQSFPWLHFVVRTLQGGELPLWDHTTYSGTTFPGELQTGAFYVGTWLFSLFAGTAPDGTIPMWQLEVFVWVHFVFCAWAMSALLADRRIPVPGVVIGSVLFAFLGTVAYRAHGQANLFFGLAWLPLAFLGLVRGLESRQPLTRNPWPVLAGFATAMPLLGGHMTPMLHVVMALTLFLPFSGRLFASRQAVLVFVTIGALSFLFSAPALLTGLEYLGDALRWIGIDRPVRADETVPYEAFGQLEILDPPQLWNFWYPRMWLRDGGSLFMTRAGFVLAVLGVLTRSRIASFAAALALGSVWIALGDHTFLGPLAWRTPIVNKVRQPIRYLYLYDFGISLLAAYGTLWWMRSKWTSKLPAFVRWTVLIAAAATVLWEADSHRLRLSQPIEGPFHPVNRFERGEVIDRLITESSAARSLQRVVIDGECIPANAGNVWHSIRSTIGHRATMGQDYFAFLGRGWDLAGDNYDRLGARWIVTRQTFEGLAVLAERGDVRLYERDNSVGIFHWENGDDAPTEAVIDTVDWHTNSVRLGLADHAGGRLVFAQVPYPGWSVSVGGRSRELIEVDGLVGVELEGGETDVRFVYSPASAWIGTLLFALGAGLGIWVLVRSHRSVPVVAEPDDPAPVV